MAVPLPNRNPFAVAIDSFIADIKRNEDVRSPFYNEVIKQASAKGNGLGAHCAEQLSAFIIELEKKQKRDNKTLRITDKLRPLMAGLNEYAQACDIMIQAAPAAAVLLYGGVRLVLHLCQNFYKCFDTVLDIMEEIGHLLKCYELFAQAYQPSGDLQSLLVESYKNIITFWQKASKLLSRKIIKTLLSNIVKPLYAEWQKCREGLHRDKERVQMLAQATEADMRRQRDVQQSKQKQQELRKQIVDWIKACEDLDVRSDIRANMDLHYGHSCEWLFENPRFRAWNEAKKTTAIWYNAPPGAGKTILTSTVVRSLQDKGQKTAVFFSSFSDPVKKHPITALRCLALQLLTLTASIPDKVLRLYEDDFENHHFKLMDPYIAVEVVEAFIKQVGRVHIFVDGLDECGAPQQLLGYLSRLLQAKTLGIVKWFFSSRPEREIRACMQKHNVNSIEAPMDSLLSDIKVFIKAQMENKLDHHCEGCVEFWTNASEGNFLWTTLMLRVMEGEGLTCEEEIDEELKKFPKGLTGCYMRSLEQLTRRPERHQQLARRILTMIVGAVQPLRLSELAHALAASAGGPHDFSVKRVPKAELIEELSSNLIVFDRSSKGDEMDPLLKIAHKSILDFLQQDPRTLGAKDDLHQFFVSSKTASYELGQSSLNYLNYARYHQEQDISELLHLPEHAFLKHAATFWHQYLNNVKHSPDLFDQIVDFVKSPAFWSCIAVQSKVAPHLFARYREIEHGGFSLEATGPTTQDIEKYVNYAVPLPMWLDEYEPEGQQIIGGLHKFVKEWHPVLNSYPSALNQCKMDDGWDKIIPGQHVWISKRVNFHSCQGNSIDQIFTKLAIKDVREDRSTSNSWTVALFGILPTKMGIIPQWLKLRIGSSGLTPLAGSQPTEPLPVQYTKGSEIFSMKFAWGGSCFFFDPVTLRLTSLQPKGQAPVASIPEPYQELGQGSWRISSKSISGSCNDEAGDQHAVAFHCISQTLTMNDSSSKYDSAFGSTTSSAYDDTDSDDGSASDSSCDSEYDQHVRHCMLFVCGAESPIYAFWTGPAERSDVVCAFHPTEKLAVWSHSAQELKVTHLSSGRTESTILPEPADVKLSPVATVRKEFRFSESGQDLLYLLYIASETENGIKQTVSMSSFHFSSTDSDGFLLQRTHQTHTISYECSGSIQYPLILTCWTSENLYIALPPLSSQTKILRLRLPDSLSSGKSATENFQTLRDSIFFPYSTSYRDPKLKVIEKCGGKDVLLLALDAKISYASESSEQHFMLQAPSIMSWEMSAQDDWRDWNPSADEQSEKLRDEKDQCKMLRGTFVDADKRFNVPIRSGLDWRKKAFLSCA
ncbi:MAG: hypothetical protein Q9157_000573 [Trypethelium eluteriae]